jgi:hypothetical protein
MATTTGSPWLLPYPEATDDVRPHEDIQSLADAAHAGLWVAYNAASAPPKVEVRRNANQSIANGGTPTPFSFDVEDVDTDTMFVVGSPTLVTIKTAGRYAVHGSCVWALAASGDRVLGLWTAGAEWVGTSTVGSSANAVRQSLSDEKFFAANATVQLRPYQNSGAAVNCVGRLTVRRIADA